MVRPSCASGCSAHPTSASTEAQARTNLRHLLHTLRRALPGLDRCLEVTPRTLAWRADSPFWLDVAAFQDLAGGDPEALASAVARTGRPARRPGRRVAGRGPRAAPPALPPCPGAPGGPARRAWRPRRAIPYAERLLRQDPLQEAAWRPLMGLHDAHGDRALAGPSGGSTRRCWASWRACCPSSSRPRRTAPARARGPTPSGAGCCSTPSPGRCSPPAGRSCWSPTTSSGPTARPSSSSTTCSGPARRPLLLVVATVRDGEVNDRHPLRDLLTGLGTLDRVAEVGLGRLSRQETAALARAAGRPLTASEADRLFAGTEGEALVLGLDELWRRRIVRDRGPDAYDFTHVGFAAGWAPDDPDSERHTAWARAGWEALRPHGTGVYVNFLSDEGATGLQATYGDRPQRPRRSGTEAEPAR